MPLVSDPSSRPIRLRRQPPPPWRRNLALAFIAFLAPLTKLVPRAWARLIGRGITRFCGNFGAYEPTEHDVLVCSYFKSGTNWTMQIAVQIAHHGRAEFEHIHDIVPWPEMPPRAAYAVDAADQSARRSAPTGLRIIKTHLALDKVPYVTVARYICVVRDPKDVFVSSYHFTRATALGPLMPHVAAWLDTFLSPNAAFGSWAKHVASYWHARKRGNVLFMTYEEMRASLPATVDKIAAFMGVALTSAERADVIARSTFEHMKSISHKFDVPASLHASARGAMVRRGERGRSDELLSPADQRRIDDYCRAELAGLGCDFPYDVAFAVATDPSAPATTVQQPVAAS